MWEKQEVAQRKVCYCFTGPSAVLHSGSTWTCMKFMREPDTTEKYCTAHSVSAASQCECRTEEEDTQWEHLWDGGYMRNKSLGKRGGGEKEREKLKIKVRAWQKRKATEVKGKRKKWWMKGGRRPLSPHLSVMAGFPELVVFSFLCVVCSPQDTQRLRDMSWSADHSIICKSQGPRVQEGKGREKSQRNIWRLCSSHEVILSHFQFLQWSQQVSTSRALGVLWASPLKSLFT